MTKQVVATETERKEIVMSSPEDVLSYWFPEEDIFDADQETFGRQMQWWFAGGPEVDREISQRFTDMLEQARRGELDHWADTPRGRLALIVVLDQFSRNVYRREEEAADAPAHLRAEAEFGISQAKGARDVIARFGRHPHRNEILGRASTPEELEYLRTETPPHLRRPPS